MNILSSFTHTQIAANLYSFLLNTKEDILKNAGNQTVDVPTTVCMSIVNVPTMEVNGVHQPFGYHFFFKYLRRKKFIQV